MIVTSTINLNGGLNKTVTNAYLLMIPYVGKIGINGKVTCELEFYYSEADADAGASKIYPIIGNDLTKPITNIVLQFIPGEIIKSDVDCTMEDVMAYFKTKLKEKLELDYGWIITI